MSLVAPCPGHPSVTILDGFGLNSENGDYIKAIVETEKSCFDAYHHCRDLDAYLAVVWDAQQLNGVNGVVLGKNSLPYMYKLIAVRSCLSTWKYRFPYDH